MREVFFATSYLVLFIGMYLTRVVGGADVGADAGAAGTVACDEGDSSDSFEEDVEYSVVDSTGLVRRCGGDASLT